MVTQGWVYVVFCLFWLFHDGSGQDTCHDIDTDACIRLQTSDPSLCSMAFAETACPDFCGKCLTTTTTPVPTQAPCEDIDTSACEIMHKSRPDLCNDPAIAQSACKRFCGNCPVSCYSCSTPVGNMADCNTTAYCDTHEECFTMEMFDFDKSHGFRAGCMPKDLCVPHGATQSLFGRRSSSLVQLKCCDKDMCNGEALQTTTTTTTTPRPTTTTTDKHHSTCRDHTSRCFLDRHYMCTHHRNECPHSCGLC